MEKKVLEKKHIIYVLCILLFLLIRYGHAIYDFEYKYMKSEYSDARTYLLQVVECVDKEEHKISYIVEYNKDLFMLNIYQSTFTKEVISLDKYGDYQYLDVLKVNGKMKFPKYYNNQGEFNYKRYLNSKNIYGNINVYVDNSKKISLVENTVYQKSFKDKVLKSIYSFRNKVSIRIDDNLTNSSALVKSMIYGNDSTLDEVVKEKFKLLGISHTLSASGSNLSTIIIVLNVFGLTLKEKNKSKSVKRKMPKVLYIIKEILIFLIISTFVFAFCVMSSLQMSILRASIMLEISLIARLYKKKTNKYFVICIAYIILMFVYPYCIFNTGCNLSFLATVGIVMFFVDIEEMISNILPKKIKNIINSENKFFVYLKVILKYIAINISLTIAVQLLILPLEIESFNELSSTLIISNIVISCFDFYIRIIGILATILYKFTLASNFLFNCLIPVTSLLEEIVLKVSLKTYCIKVISLPLYIYFIYYFLVISLKIYMTKKKKSEPKKELKKITTINIILITILVILTYNYYIYNKYIYNYVSFFNVGQGEMAYIKYGENKVVIDAGSKVQGVAFNILNAYFKSKNIQEVDVLCISHFHSDHINGIEDLLNNIRVKKIICGMQYGYDKSNEAYINYMSIKEKAETLDIEFCELKYNEHVLVGKIDIRAVSIDNLVTNDKDMVNATSLVLDVTVADKSILFMGDATKNTETAILQKENNRRETFIIKIGHHGSSSSTSSELLERFNPKFAVISSQYSYYHHPSKLTLNILKQNNVFIYLTEELGQITFKIK